MTKEERDQIKKNLMLKTVKVEGWPGRITDVTVSTPNNVVYVSLSMDAMDAEYQFGHKWFNINKVEVL